MNKMNYQKMHFPHQRQQAGATALIMTLILFTLSTIIVIFASNFGTLYTKSIANMESKSKSFEAAQAGLEFGINYLRKNSSTILAFPINGYIRPYSSSDTTDVTLPNNSKYSITYTNPVANDYSLILVGVVGSNPDDTATSNVSQLVEFGSLLLNQPSMPLITKSSVSLSNSARIYNSFNDNTIDSGSNININNSAYTQLSSGISSTAAALGPDVTENNTTLASTSDADLYSNYFGISESQAKSKFTNVFSSSTDSNYNSELAGLKGKSIWIDQSAGTATISGFTTVGSSSNPVIMVIKGNADIKGYVIIYGFVFIDSTATTQISDGAILVGGVVSTGPIKLEDSAIIVYSPTILNNLRNQSSMMYYARVLGSWKDF